MMILNNFLKKNHIPISINFTPERRMIISDVGTNYTDSLDIGDEIIAINGLSVAFIFYNPDLLFNLFETELQKRKFIVISYKNGLTFEISFTKKKRKPGIIKRLIFKQKEGIQPTEKKII